VRHMSRIVYHAKRIVETTAISDSEEN